ncbi:MAG TPA: trehalase family glycosidase [Candidatus Limnocylindrales bacterium]|nr:trehalase family glycosidase [Candidatus Limnocylindrales bacterium]
MQFSSRTFSPSSLTAILLLTLCLSSAQSWLFAQAPARAPQVAPAPQQNILPYIKNAWNTLGRSMNDCSSISDPKFGAGATSVLYLPYGVTAPPAVAALSKCGVKVENLPKKITGLGTIPVDQLNAHGLLYLPNKYVVPGGRFNEMYGWDSYFIIIGLLEDGERDYARGIIENFFYEIENYGAVLNANRAYYLTRSQPPFLTSMIMAQYAADKKAGKDDKKWLARAYDYAVRDHDLWIKPPKLAGDTGLARYFDVGEGPVPDIADHPEYYAAIADWLLKHPDEEAKYSYIAPTLEKGIGPELQVPVCDNKPCEEHHPVKLTADFYQGDRAMRESGFDPSFRWGPFDGSTHHFAPVCLNSLLYKAEMDLAEMATILGHPEDAKKWRAAAETRKQLINKYLWNADKGMFFDWDFTTGKQSDYNYVTTFYPLWVGLATPEQAKAVMKNLGLFEHEGGLAMSDQQTGVQWDLHYGWAPNHLIAVEGMRRNGFNSDADRVSVKFLDTIQSNFKRTVTIREKYNVVTGSDEAPVLAGYHENLIGFGWTNGTFLALCHALPADQQKQVLEGK